MSESVTTRYWPISPTIGYDQPKPPVVRFESDAVIDGMAAGDIAVGDMLVVFPDGPNPSRWVKVREDLMGMSYFVPIWALSE